MWFFVASSDNYSNTFNKKLIWRKSKVGNLLLAGEGHFSIQAGDLSTIGRSNNSMHRIMALLNIQISYTTHYYLSLFLFLLTGAKVR